MEKIITLAIPALTALVLVRAMLVPVQFIFRAFVHGLGGFACLWLLNTVSGFTGICLPMNALTILAAGFGGFPGIGLIALLEII